MKVVSAGVFPKDSIGAVDVGSSQCLPTAVDAFIDLLSIRGDGDWITVVYGDGIEASGGVFLERNLTSSVDAGVIGTDFVITV